MKILLSVSVMDHDGQRPESSDKRLFIKNIDWNVSHEEFLNVCKQQVEGVKLVEFVKNSKGKFIGSAIVDFETHENAMAAIKELHQYVFNGFLNVDKVLFRKYCGNGVPDWAAHPKKENFPYPLEVFFSPS